MHPCSVVAILLIVLMCTTSVAAQGNITVVSWGGAYEKAQQHAIVDSFTESSQSVVHTQQYQGGLDALINRAAEEKWDVIDMVEDQAISACDAGLLEPIKPLLADSILSSPSARADFIPGSFRECSIAQNVFATVYAYDNRAFPGEKPTTISDFFDIEKFPGKRAIAQNPDVILEWALLARGAPLSQVYDLLSTERGLRLAFEKLETLRDHIVWWSDPATPAALLKSREVVMSSGFNGRFFDASRNQGTPLTIVWDGHVISYSVWAVLKSSANKPLAKEFIRHATLPDTMAALAEHIPYGPTRASAMSRIGLHKPTGIPMRMQLPNAPQHIEKALFTDSEWYSHTHDLRTRRFKHWLVK